MCLTLLTIPCTQNRYANCLHRLKREADEEANLVTLMSRDYKDHACSTWSWLFFVVKGRCNTAMNCPGFLLCLCAVLSLLSSSASVDRGNFKKCQDSSFCK